VTQLKLGELLKKEGIERVYLNNEEWVSEARREAVRISSRIGSVSAVDIRRWADRTGYHPQSPNAWGAVFRGKQWKPTGVWEKARHAEGHARQVQVWKYVSTIYKEEGT
jgi:hypothetical protein